MITGPNTTTTAASIATRVVSVKAVEPHANPANTATATTSASSPATDVTVARAPCVMLSCNRTSDTTMASCSAPYPTPTATIPAG